MKSASATPREASRGMDRLDTPVADCLSGISRVCHTRITNALGRHGLTTIGHLLTVGHGYVSGIDNIGEGSRDTLAGVIESSGIVWRERPQPDDIAHLYTWLGHVVFVGPSLPPLQPLSWLHYPERTTIVREGSAISVLEAMTIKREPLAKLITRDSVSANSPQTLDHADLVIAEARNFERLFTQARQDMAAQQA